MSYSANQIWDPATWMQGLHRDTTLYLGDVLWMGTEGTDGTLVPGDVLTVESRRIGVRSHDVVAEA